MIEIMQHHPLENSPPDKYPTVQDADRFLEPLWKIHWSKERIRQDLAESFPDYRPPEDIRAT